MSLTLELSPYTVAMLTDERRTACHLCGGRCDPKRWLCSNCDAWATSDMLHTLIDEAVNNDSEA